MSGHRAGRITDDAINELVSKLQSLLPESPRRGAAGRSSSSSSSKLLQETCRYVRSLHREADDLRNRLSELMATMDGDSPQADIIRNLLRSL